MLLVAALYVLWAYTRPLPNLKPVVTGSTAVNTTENLNWPGGTQAALSISGTKIFETHDEQVPLPTASTAKVITALVVLNVKPIDPGGNGPTITLGPSDVALYAKYKAVGGSVVPVASGEKINEYQMLQAMMLPSANNMADSLAIWAFGSLNAYQKAATAFLAQNNINHTTIGTDASGYSPNTLSTATDLTKIGNLAMQNSVLANIVSQSSTNNIPLAGTVKNVNVLLGKSGIVGVKTGNTDQAGGVFISASKINVNNQPTQIITSVIGASNLFEAMQNSLALIQSAQANFSEVPVFESTAIVGHYIVPWANNQVMNAVTSDSLKVTDWQGSKIVPVTILRSIPSNTKAGEAVGSVSVKSNYSSYSQNVSVKINSTVPRASITWRLEHPW